MMKPINCVCSSLSNLVNKFGICLHVNFRSFIHRRVHNFPDESNYLRVKFSAFIFVCISRKTFLSSRFLSFLFGRIRIDINLSLSVVTFTRAMYGEDSGFS